MLINGLVFNSMLLKDYEPAYAIMTDSSFELSSLLKNVNVEGVAGLVKPIFSNAVGIIQSLYNADNLNDFKNRLSELSRMVSEMGFEVNDFEGLASRIIGKIKRGSRADDDVGRLVRLVFSHLKMHALQLLAREYTVLNTGEYAIILLKPPVKGYYDYPKDIFEQSRVLASILPSIVRISKPDDYDYAFSKVMNTTYSSILSKAYLKLIGLNISIPQDYIRFTVSIARSLMNGYLTIIHDDEYDYFGLQINKECDVYRLIDLIYNLKIEYQFKPSPNQVSYPLLK